MIWNKKIGESGFLQIFTIDEMKLTKKSVSDRDVFKVFVWTYKPGSSCKLVSRKYNSLQDSFNLNSLHINQNQDQDQEQDGGLVSSVNYNTAGGKLEILHWTRSEHEVLLEDMWFKWSKPSSFLLGLPETIILLEQSNTWSVYCGLLSMWCIRVQ